MIPQSFIDDLLHRVDVVEVVGRYVKLKKGGANFVGLCPFHNEKSPSFTVSPSKQFYHCFGCGAHGTAIGFLIEYAGLPFPDAVRELAQSQGLTVPDVRDDASTAGSLPTRGTRGAADAVPARSQAQRLSETLAAALAYYRNALRGSPRAIDYLKRRGLSGEIAARFGLGFAPDGWQNLERAFADYRDPVLIEAGLVVAKEVGREIADRDMPDSIEASTTDGATEMETKAATRIYDRFRDRIMFPIRNTKGQVIGFGGRVIDQGEPKYLNSPETPVFQKGRELYGLFEARQAIREAGFAIVVEGYMDVVALAQMGVANAVATLGTACTVTHVQKLLRQTDRIVFSFDGDAAGRRAAWRALAASLPLAADDKSLSFLFLPSEHDPDSFIREAGRDAFLDAAAHALPLSGYLIHEVSSTNDLATAEGRAKAQFDARPLVQALPVGALRMQIVRELSRVTGASPSEVVEAFALGSTGSKRVRAARIERRAPQGLAQRVLETLIIYPALAETLEPAEVDALTRAASEHGDLILEVIRAVRGMQAPVDFLALSDVLRDSENAAVYENLMQEVLRLDETKRDLLLHDTEDSSQTERRDQQRALRAAELRHAIAKLREQAIGAELSRLAATGLKDAASAETYRRLALEQSQLRACL